MEQIFPLFITVFLSVFHMLGGGAVGQGFRESQRRSNKAMSFFAWGAVMGLLPLVFDWFFLIAQGNLIYGLIGPLLFIISTLATAFLTLKIDGGAVISATMGSVAFLLGILSVPLMLDGVKRANPGITDYAFGGCFVLMFVVIGGAFAWNGFSAIFRGATLDQEYAEREQKWEERSQSKRSKE